jgi:hypothetical protein
VRPEESSELEALQDPNAWDWDSAERAAKPKNVGAVVAVRFSLGELTQLNDAADRKGVPLTQFIHDTVLAQLAATASADRSG